jgi:hypothetical protein
MNNADEKEANPPGSDAYIERAKASDIAMVWKTLQEAAKGTRSLTAVDAEELLILFAEMTNIKVDETHEEVASKILDKVETNGSDLVQMDDKFLHYLTSNYSQVIDESNFEGEDVPSLSTVPSVKNMDERRESIQELVIMTPELQSALSRVTKWDFDVNLIPTMTRHPLIVVTEAALNVIGAVGEFNLHKNNLRRFLFEIQESYLKLPYHSCVHGADVTQTMLHLCTEGHIVDAIGNNNLATMAMILSACMHDVAHPGITAKHIIATGHPLAIQYNDRSPLENMHIATAFRIWLKPTNNFTKLMPKTLFKELRRLVIELVLATDNDLHFTLTEKLDSMLNADAVAASASTCNSAATSPNRSCTPSKSRGPSRRNSQIPLQGKNSMSSEFSQQLYVTDSRQLLMMQMALHAADVSNLAKPWHIYVTWLPRIMEEFYTQGDQEKEKGLPVTFAFDRDNPVPTHKFQVVSYMNRNSSELVSHISSSMSDPFLVHLCIMYRCCVYVGLRPCDRGAAI